MEAEKTLFVALEKSSSEELSEMPLLRQKMRNGRQKQAWAGASELISKLLLAQAPKALEISAFTVLRAGRGQLTCEQVDEGMKRALYEQKRRVSSKLDKSNSDRYKFEENGWNHLSAKALWLKNNLGWFASEESVLISLGFCLKMVSDIAKCSSLNAQEAVLRALKKSISANRIINSQDLCKEVENGILAYKMASGRGSVSPMMRSKYC